MLSNQDWLDKPHFPFWMSAISFKIFGNKLCSACLSQAWRWRMSISLFNPHAKSISHPLKLFFRPRTVRPPFFISSAKGVFLAFQYPLEIPGVTTMTFLKACMNAQRKARGEAEFSTPDFMKRVRAGADKIGVPQDMLRRALNVGFSGGEKKRMEVLQMVLLEPKVAILDETDSGLDIDALRIVAEGVNALRSPDRAFVVITHHQRLLDYIVPDSVHVLSAGRIVKSGDKELAHELEKNGYRDYVADAA